MFIYFNLALLTLVLTLGGQVHAGKIIGGHEAEPHSRPYMVLLEVTNECGKKKHCGGFLLSEDFVVTAAHCQAKSYKVFLGFNNYRRETKVCLSVKQAFPHAGYKKKIFRNDIMLLKLSSKANFTDKVKPIALADQDDGSLPKSCSVSGWGQTNIHNGRLSLTLMEVNVTLINSDQCAEENVYCSEGEEGPGSGDSGGPLVCDGKAYGVVSASMMQNSGSILSKYTKIPDHRGWIYNRMNLN